MIILIRADFDAQNTDILLRKMQIIPPNPDWQSYHYL
jgi:hypothetical protein